MTKYEDESEYNEKPNTSLLCPLETNRGVTSRIKYAKWMAPYEIQTDALWLVPPMTKNITLKTIRNTKSIITHSICVFFKKNTSFMCFDS
jgi:hypothetical protein